jgi:aspartate ammonia-lyase
MTMHKMTVEEKFELINNIELFRGLSRKELLQLSDEARETVYETGEFLFKENMPRKQLFLIAEGRVELFKSTPLGEEKQITNFSRYDFLGEGSLMEDSPHSTSARATEQSVVLVIDGEVLSKSATIAIATLSNITKVVSRRMRYANTRAMNSTAQYESGKTRREHDLLGDRDVPYEYYYGIQTLRALENFNISGVTLSFFPDFIDALGNGKNGRSKSKP